MTGFLPSLMSLSSLSTWEIRLMLALLIVIMTKIMLSIIRDIIMLMT